MMNEKFIDAISELATKASEPKIVAVGEGGASHVRYVWQPGTAKLEKIELAPANRRHTACDLETAIAAAIKYVPTSAVWYSRKAVQVLLDDGTRRDWVTLGLPVTPQFAWLRDNDRPTKLKHAALLFLLRTTFKECLPYGNSLVAQLRRVNWKQMKDSESEIQKNKASIGKSIKSELSGAEDLPEYVVLNVPVFNVVGLMTGFRVECVLEVSPEDESFMFFPVPNAVELAYQEAEQMLCKRLTDALEESGVAVNHGTP